MKKPTLLPALVRNILILLILLALILIPRPAAGYLDIRQARRFEATGNYAAAAGAYVMAVERLPSEPSLLENAADVFLHEKDYLHAEYYYELANNSNALSPSGVMSWGDTKFVLGDPGFAVGLWNNLMDRQGNPSILLPRIAHAYQTLALHSADHSLELYSEEIQAWQKYLVYQPGDAAALYRLGLLYTATSPADALPELMLADRLDPSLDASIQSLRSALITALISNDHSYQFVVSGQGLGALGDWDLAAVAFRNAISVQPDYAEAWAWLGEAKQQEGQDGSNEMEKALEFNPNSAMVQSLYGLYLQRQEKPEQALAAFQKAAALEPENAGWQMALGQAYEQAGDLVAALDHYKSAVELSPDEATFWRALAEFSLRNNVDIAGTGLPAVLRLVELAKNDWQSDDIAGQILMETDDMVGAEVLLKKAIELDPTQAAPSLHLGLLYLQTGNRAGAYSCLNQAKVFDPDGPIGWQANRLLEQYFP